MDSFSAVTYTISQELGRKHHSQIGSDSNKIPHVKCVDISLNPLLTRDLGSECAVDEFLVSSRDGNAFEAPSEEPRYGLDDSFGDESRVLVV